MDEVFDEITESQIQAIEKVICAHFGDIVGLRASCRFNVKSKNYSRWWSNIINHQENAAIIVQQLEEMDGIH